MTFLALGRDANHDVCNQRWRKNDEWRNAVGATHPVFEHVLYQLFFFFTELENGGDRTDELLSLRENI